MDDLTQNLSKIIRDNLYKNFTKAAEQIKKVIISEYDELTSIIEDPNSNANPALYRDDFIKRLDNFSYVTDVGGNISINVPDMETFDFSGRLKVIETIINGISGSYIEMSGEEYKSIFKRAPFSPDSKGAENLSEEDIYLIRYNHNIQNIEKHLKKKFVKYPFSNMPPFDILEKGEAFVDKNMERWIEETIEDAKQEI
jgi:hypothetical protein